MSEYQEKSLDLAPEQLTKKRYLDHVAEILFCE